MIEAIADLKVRAEKTEAAAQFAVVNDLAKVCYLLLCMFTSSYAFTGCPVPVTHTWFLS